MEKLILIVSSLLFVLSLTMVAVAFKKESKFWTKIKWYVQEIIAMSSGKQSYFSLKRFHQITAMYLFFAGWVKILHMMIINDIANPMVFNINNYMVWATPLLAIGGYYNYVTQKEKVTENKDQQTADTEVK